MRGRSGGRQEVPARLERLHEKIERWRRERRKISPMPEALWNEATALARWLSVFQVARALRLNYASLRDRADRWCRVSHRSEGRQEGFVELSGAQLLASSSGVVVEIVDGDGARLSVRLAGAGDLDVARLIEAFRERRK